MNKEKLKKEVIEIYELEDNWDGYGAEPFAQKTIDKVNEVIDCLDDKYVDPDIVPSCIGIQLEWENGENALEIYVGEKADDDLSYLKVVGKDIDDWIDEDISDMGEINELLKWLYKKI